MRFIDKSAAELAYPKTIHLVGVSHKTLPIAERESLARIAESGKAVLHEVAKSLELKEVAVISTCNRFEVVAIGDGVGDNLKKFLKNALPQGVSETSIYTHQNREAVSHLFKVAASLDSLAVGEAQILGQVKDAYHTSVTEGFAGRYLHSLFQFAFRLAKKVRGNTTIGEKGGSISYVAVKLAEKIFGELSGHAVLVIGSGKMAELTALHLKSHGCRDITVANRTLERAASLASRVGGSAISLDEIEATLDRVDMVIGSVHADSTIIEPRSLKKRKRGSPLFLIDLGVPRNFSPALGDIDDVFLYNIDDLSTMAAENRVEKEEAGKDAEVIVEYGLLQFERWIHKVAAEPELLSLRGRIYEVCKEELDDVLGSKVAVEERDRIVEEIAHAISQKISHELHGVIVKGNPGSEDESEVEKILPLIFDELLKVKTK